jgi:hypothetical protein
LRDLVFVVTFLCVTLGAIVSSGEALPLVLINTAMLALAIVLTGGALYRSILAGWLIAPLLLIDVFLQPTYHDIITSREAVPEILTAMCLGAVCGGLWGLRKSGKEWLPMCMLSVAMVDILWLLLPRIE